MLQIHRYKTQNQNQEQPPASTHIVLYLRFTK